MSEDLKDSIPGAGLSTPELTREATKRYEDLTPYELEALADRLERDGNRLFDDRDEDIIRGFTRDGVAYSKEDGTPLDIDGLLPRDRAHTLASICLDIARAKSNGYDFNFSKCLSEDFHRRRQIAQEVMGQLPKSQQSVTRVYQEVADIEGDNVSVDAVRKTFTRARGNSDCTTREEKWNELRALIRYGWKLYYLTGPK